MLKEQCASYKHNIYLYLPGIPVWVGQKLYTRYEKANKHKRNAFIAGGVTASVSLLNISDKHDI